MECQKVDLSDEACLQASQEAELRLASETKKKRFASLRSESEILKKSEELLLVYTTQKRNGHVWDSWRFQRDLQQDVYFYMKVM